jgi:hypothetical protein
LAVVATAALALAACTTTNTKVASTEHLSKPAPGSRVLLIEPDVSLALLTASGVQEPRADWSDSAETNLAKHIESDLKVKSHGLKTLDPDEAMGGRVGQLLRLNDTVVQSIGAFNYGLYKLPTKKSFDWTLGEGAQELGRQYDADYALFVNGRGSYASGGRVAAMVGLSLLGVGVPLGGQSASASLVDLKTGRVVWFNVAVASPSADMREDAGADALVASLLKDIPL